MRRTFETEVMLDCAVSYEWEPGSGQVDSIEVVALIPREALEKALADAQAGEVTSLGFCRVNIIGSLLRSEASSVESDCESDLELVREEED